MIFENLRFLILPTDLEARMNILGKLIVSNGGKLINSCVEIDDNTVVLINDSFVESENNTILQFEIFKREFGLDYDETIQIILEKKLSCVSTNCVSKWIKENRFALNNCPVIYGLSNKIDLSQDTSNDNSLCTSSRETQTESDTEESEGDDDANINIQSSIVKPSEKSQVTEKQMPISMKNNELLTKALEGLHRKYEAEGDKFRARGYKLAKASIQNCPFQIMSGQEAQERLENIGPSIAKKIQLILDTGLLPGLEESKDLESRLIYFKKCHSVGSYTAKRWNLLKFKTFNEVLEKAPNEVVDDWSILFGWSYFDDWDKPLLRSECEEHLRIVRKALKSISAKCEVELQGSYIREQETCGDIDLLFFMEDCDDTKEISSILEQLIIKLFEEGYIKCLLQLSATLYPYFKTIIEERYSKAKSKIPENVSHRFHYEKILKKYYLGVKLSRSQYRKFYDQKLNDQGVKLQDDDRYMSLNARNSISDPPCRRLDFFSCRWSELGAARIHYTGSKEFNRWIRMDATIKGYKLTQHGLFKDDVLIESFDERRIFEILNVKYLSRKDRAQGLWEQKKEE